MELVTSFKHGSESSKVVISVLQYGTEMKGWQSFSYSLLWWYQMFRCQFSLLFHFSPEGLYGNEFFIHAVLEDFEVQLLVLGSCFCTDFSKN